MVATGAANLLEQAPDDLPPFTRILLSFCSVLDDLGAWTWNLRLVAVATASFLLGIRLLFGKKYGIDWYALLHALASSIGAIVCTYLDVFAAEELTGMPEPLRSVQCHGPLTSLHRIVPAITMGYALFDFLDGLTISVDFMMHGAATLAVMAFFCELGEPQFITPMLLMEASTPFLTIVRCEFFTPTMSMINQLCFMVSFFAFRIVIVPYLWFNLMVTLMAEKDTTVFQSCFPGHFVALIFLFGCFFHVLNSYWFVKIVKKARRKLMGIEKIKGNNDLGEKHLKKQK